MTGSLEVRPFAREDVEGVLALQRAVFPAIGRRPPEEVARKLVDLYFGSPYTRHPLPHVVLDETGRHVGFRGFLVRTWRVDGEPLPVFTGTGLAVHPEARRRGVATAMVQAARARAREIGLVHAFHLADRPAPTRASLGFGASAGDEHLEAYGFAWSAPLSRSVLARLLGRGGPPAPSPAPAPLTEEALGAEGLAAVFAELGRERTPHLDPDPEPLRWLLAYMSDYPSRGRFEARLLGDGTRPVGFLAGYLGGDHFEVVASGSVREQRAAATAQLFALARGLGAKSIRGRAAAWELRPLLALGARIQPGTPLAFREGSEPLRERFRTGDALLTGIEGEAWI